MIIKGITKIILNRLSVLGLSKAVFADKLGLSEKSLQRMLDSEDVKKLDTFVYLCRFLRLSPSTILAEDVLQHPFMEYFDIIEEGTDSHLVKLLIDKGEGVTRKDLLFTKGAKGEYYSDQQKELFDNIHLLYSSHYEGVGESKGLMVAKLTEDTPELDLIKEDYVLAIKYPNLNHTYIDYVKNGIGHLLIEFPNTDGNADYGIMKVVNGNRLSFKQAMNTDDNAVVFVDDKLYSEWLNTSLPKSNYDINIFKSKVFQSVDLLNFDRFKMYPIVGIVRNITMRILRKHAEEQKKL